jgi:hypothetical protein
MILVIDTRNVIESITLKLFDNFIDDDKKGPFLAILTIDLALQRWEICGRPN